MISKLSLSSSLCSCEGIGTHAVKQTQGKLSPRCLDLGHRGGRSMLQPPTSNCELSSQCQHCRPGSIMSHTLPKNENRHEFLYMLSAQSTQSTSAAEKQTPLSISKKSHAAFYLQITPLHPPHLRAYDRSMVFEWLGAYDCSTSFALRALSTCLCVKLHVSASRSREHRFH